VKILAAILLLSALSSTAAAQADEHPWVDERLPDDKRVQSLIDAMTVAEKMAQLQADAPGIERLGILPYNWWNEALHGVARSGRATVFPQPIGMAATFDEELIHRVATAISDEARAKFNIAQEIGNYDRYAGLTFWSPNVNIFRDPRWGRGMETYGEDPYLQSRLGTAFVRGLQGNDPRHMKAAACAKHYAVHSGPEKLRHEFDAIAPKRDIAETYLPAFEALVKEGRVECVMCAYNRVDGEPACGSQLLLQDILRDDWGFEGHVVSDCGAVRDFHKRHKVAADEAEAAAWALKAGTDVNCGRYFAHLPAALERKLISKADIDTALRRLLNTKFKLGLFDIDTPWNDLGAEIVERDGHVDLSLEAARKSIVLLRNANNALPLKKDIRRLFVTGPHAASVDILLGNYHGLSSETVTILDGIVGKVSVGTTVDYRYGQLPYSANVNPANSAIGAAAQADAIVAVLGISTLVEGEEGSAVASPSKGDRLNLSLPPDQLAFLRKLRERSEQPIIVVLTGGSPIAAPELEQLADAILFAWYPGQQGGKAVADVIFGDVNPSARLPVTFPVSVNQLPPYEDYSMEGRTYKYMKEKPLYPFGFGLSYTSFEYGKPSLPSSQLSAGEPLIIDVSVRNTGEVAGTEIVQIYHSTDAAPFDVPNSSLVGFRPVALGAGEEKTVRFAIAATQLRSFGPDGEAVLVKGRHSIRAGGVSPGERGEELTGQSLQAVRFEIR
jgi:beta-glucosidase